MHYKWLGSEEQPETEDAGSWNANIQVGPQYEWGVWTKGQIRSLDTKIVSLKCWVTNRPYNKKIIYTKQEKKSSTEYRQNKD